MGKGGHSLATDVGRAPLEKLLAAVSAASSAASRSAAAAAQTASVTKAGAYITASLHHSTRRNISSRKALFRELPMPVTVCAHKHRRAACVLLRRTTAGTPTRRSASATASGAAEAMAAAAEAKERVGDALTVFKWLQQELRQSEAQCERLRLDHLKAVGEHAEAAKAAEMNINRLQAMVRGLYLFARHNCNHLKHIGGYGTYVWKVESSEMEATNERQRSTDVEQQFEAQVRHQLTHIFALSSFLSDKTALGGASDTDGKVV
eukprot:6191421-Pleurochrysis_carterae.AAC.7